MPGTTAIALAGLESAKLLLGMFPDFDQRQKKIFEADYAIYVIQKTLPNDHPDINDGLFLRVRDRLFHGIEAVNKFAKANGKNSEPL